MIVKRTLLALALALWAPVVAAQGLFSPVVTVDGQAVTQYELDQRARLLEFFDTRGDLRELALEQLIEDRLKQAEMRQAGLRISDEALTAELETFAARAELSLEELIPVLAQQGIAVETLRDFVEVGVTWRDYVRVRFAPRVTITDAEVDRELEQRGARGGQVQILLSEIIIAAPPEMAERAARAAEQISAMRSFDEFSAAAAQVSALPTREQGGRLDWLPLTNFPPALRQPLFELEVGEVTEPIGIENGIALFQKRGVREVAVPTPAPASIDYATYLIPGGNSAEARSEAAQITTRLDTCDDLYGVNLGSDPARITRRTAAPGAIPSSLATQLARMDVGETSYATTTADGANLILVMLCARTSVAGAELDRDAVLEQLRSRQLAGYADGLLEDLRARANIR